MADEYNEWFISPMSQCFGAVPPKTDDDDVDYEVDDDAANISAAAEARFNKVRSTLVCLCMYIEFGVLRYNKQRQERATAAA